MVKETGLNGKLGQLEELCVCVQPCCQDGKLLVSSRQEGAGRAVPQKHGGKACGAVRVSSRPVLVVPAAPAAPSSVLEPSGAQLRPGSRAGLAGTSLGLSCWW